MTQILEVALGPRQALDLIYNVGGIDAATVLNWQNRNGINPEQVINRLAAAVGSVNQFVITRYGGVSFFTTDLMARYRQGDTGARKTPVKTEGATQDPIRSSETGHMLPLRTFEDTLGWTAEYLEGAYDSQIEADLALLSESFINRADYDILNRMFSNANESVGGGYSVPWAIGDDGTVPYIPPQSGATAFDTTHTHFIYKDGANAAKFLESLNEAIVHLRHHGITGRLLAFVSEADVNTWGAVEGFVKLQPAGMTVVTGGSSEVQIISGETEGVPGTLMGYVTTLRGVVELRYLENIPTSYYFLTRSYGQNNPQNGIAIRLYPGRPFGLIPDVIVTQHLQPKMKAITAEARHGVGINKRLNGVAGRVATGIVSYTAPSIGS